MDKPVILVVDDEELNIDYVVSILKDKYDIRVANNGKMALNILNKFKIDLILLDIKMPIMDGYEVANEIINNNSLSYIPFIFLTSKSDEASIIKGFEMGAKDYISKPFNSQELKVRVENHIQTYLLQQDLQKQVEEKTKEIIKQKEELFLQMKKSSMGELIGIIAHQLKQPLSGIYLAIDLIADKYYFNELDKNSLDKQRYIITSQVEFMSQSIDELRNFFRPDKKKETYNLKNATDKVLSLLNTTISSQGIEINPNIDETLSLFGYENELQQVLINIITNARDILIQTKTENPYININGYKKDNKIYIEIEDNGGGIPNNIIDKIFDSYFTTKGEKGTGIGLNLAKMIIESSMNGKLTAKNNQYGAIFSIELDK